MDDEKGKSLSKPEFKWKTQKYSITLPAPKTRAQKWALFLFTRQIKEAKEISNKKMYSITSGKTIYHHGDPV